MTRFEEIRVGVFVLLALAAAIVVSFWILGTGPFASTPNRYEVRLYSSGGVRAGDKVRIAGVASGRIESLRLDPGAERSVVLDISLDRDLILHRDASAHLASDGLLGSSYVEVDPGDPAAGPIDPGSTLLGDQRGSLEGVYAQLDTLAATANDALKQISSLAANLESGLQPILDGMGQLASEQNIDAISRVLSETELTLGEMRPRLNTVLDRADALVVELQSGVEGFPALSEEVLGLTQDLRTGLGEDGARLTAVLETAQATLESLDAEKGATAELIGELEATLASVRTLAETLSERPGSLVGLRGERDRKPAPTGSRRNRP